MKTDDDAYFRVPRTTHATSEGEVELPILYRDTKQLIAMFDVDAGFAAQKLAAVGLTPLLVAGVAQAALVFFEYPETSIGPYNEVGLAVFGVPRGTPTSPLTMLEMLRHPRKRALGAHVLNLPVTTAAANAAGRELWGYPKFVTQIPIEWRGREFHGRVLDPEGATICDLTGKRTFGAPFPTPGLLLYSRLGDTNLRTTVDVKGASNVALGGSMRLTVGPSQHDMATNLRALGLDGATPRLVLVGPATRSLLHVGIRY